MALPPPGSIDAGDFLGGETHPPATILRRSQLLAVRPGTLGLPQNWRYLG